MSPHFIREQVIDAIRGFFKNQGFHEVFTPILVPTPGTEPNLEVFETQLRTYSGTTRRGFLITSPEYAHKKLLSQGFGNIFEITRSFRNEEEVSPQHNPEFTILEYYRVKADYTAIMPDVEQLFIHVIKTVNPQVNLKAWEYQGQLYDISSPWLRLSVADAFLKYCDIDTDTLLSPNLITTAAKKGYSIDKSTTWEQAFYQLFFNCIEPQLKASHRPVIIYDYPIQQAALARKKPTDPRFAERFEVFLAGLELGNCYSELTDPAEQKSRIESDLKERASLHKTSYPADTEFLAALQSGLPPCSGIAIGVDRLVMLAANVSDISQTLTFPAKTLFCL